MKISKKSWHYRLLNKIGVIGYNESLCAYFWKVVLLTVVAPVVFTGVAILALLPFYWWLIFTDVGDIALPICVGILDILGLSILWANYRDHLREIGKLSYKIAKPLVFKEPSLFSLWLKAKHRQVCPYLDFE